MKGRLEGESGRPLPGRGEWPGVLRALLVHWDEATLPAKAAQVEAAGHKVVGGEAVDGARALQKAKDLAPDVLVVWATHRPSHGRTTAAAIRSYPWGRGIHCLVVEGDPEPLPKPARAKLAEVLPEAVLVTPATLPVWLGKVEAAIAATRRVV